MSKLEERAVAVEMQCDRIARETIYLLMLGSSGTDNAAAEPTGHKPFPARALLDRWDMASLLPL